MTISLSLLGVDLQNASPSARKALSLNREELEALVLEVRQASALELVIVSSSERFEVYTTEESAPSVFRHVLRELVSRAGGRAALAPVPSIDARGIAVARHLFELATGSAGSSIDVGDLTLAVARSRAADALGPELESLFLRAIEAGVRVYRETALGDVTTSQAALDVARFEVERIREEEIVSWMATKSAATSLPPAPIDSTYYSSQEPGSTVRGTVPGLQGSRVA
jgi:glutamyl-tRNA reductase